MGRSEPVVAQMLNAQSVGAWADAVKDAVGLEKWFVHLRGDTLYLAMLVVPKNARKAGRGTRAVEHLVRFADCHGLRIALTAGRPADGQGTTSRTRLLRFFKRFGFRENRGAQKDFTISEGMVREPQQGVRHGEERKFTEEVTDAYKGQVNVRMVLRAHGLVVGTLDYAVYQGEPTISMIEVAPFARRQGHATAMLQELQRKFSGVEIRWGMLTDDGAALYNVVTFRVEDTEVVAMQSEFAKIRGDIERLRKAAQTDPAAASGLNALYDRESELEYALRGKTLTKAFIKLPERAIAEGEQGMGKSQKLEYSYHLDNDGTANVYRAGTSNRVAWFSVDELVEAGKIAHRFDTEGILKDLRSDGTLPEGAVLRGLPELTFGYYIDLDERGEFRADVRNIDDKTVYEISGFEIFEDGFMKHKEDLEGLRAYMVELGFMPEGADLLNERDFENRQEEIQRASVSQKAKP